MANEDIATKTKKYISSLLTSTPLVCTVRQLSNDYRNTIGEDIPYHRMGYNSLEHFLTCIPDTVRVVGRGPNAEVHVVVSEKSAHINSLVTKQKIPAKKPPKGLHSRYNYHAPAKRYDTQPNSPRYQDTGGGQNRSSKKIQYPPPTFGPNAKYFSNIQTSNGRTSSNDYSNQPSSSRPSRSHTPDTQRKPQYNENKQQYSKPAPVQEEPVPKPERIEHKLANNITESQSNTARDFKEEWTRNVEEPHKENNKTISDDRPKTVCDMLPSPSGRDKIQFVVGRKQVVSKEMVKGNALVKNKVSLPITNEDLSSVPNNVQQNLRKLISSHQEGIWCTKLPILYKDRFGSTLHYQRYGYHCLIDMCVALPHIFHYVRPSQDDFKLYDATKPLPDDVGKSYTMASYDADDGIEKFSAAPDLDWEVVADYTPEDIVKLGEEIPRAKIPFDQEKEDLEVGIGEIYDPSKFWIYLNYNMLNKLMDEMQMFYSENSQKYAIPQFLLVEGLYCAQLIYGEYHRAIITNTRTQVKGEIRVLFIDYGTMTRTSTKGICFLPKKFAQLPSQAIRARLANICPPVEHTPWSIEASQRFRQLVDDRDISAKISYIDRVEGILEVHLADTTGQKIFYLNDVLVEEGHAQFLNKERKCSVLKPSFPAIVENLHLFPTFAELEYGLAPSTAEMFMFQRLEVPLNFCYPQYFKTEHADENMDELAEEHRRNYMMKSPEILVYPDVENLLLERNFKFSVFGELEEEISAILDSEVQEDYDFVIEEDKTLETDRESPFPDHYHPLLDTTLEKCTSDKIENLKIFMDSILDDLNDGTREGKLSKLGSRKELTLKAFSHFNHNCSIEETTSSKTILRMGSNDFQSEESRCLLSEDNDSSSNSCKTRLQSSVTGSKESFHILSKITFNFDKDETEDVNNSSVLSTVSTNPFALDPYLITQDSQEKGSNPFLDNYEAGNAPEFQKPDASSEKLLEIFESHEKFKEDLFKTEINIDDIELPGINPDIDQSSTSTEYEFCTKNFTSETVGINNSQEVDANAAVVSTEISEDSKVSSNGESVDSNKNLETDMSIETTDDSKEPTPCEKNPFRVSKENESNAEPPALRPPPGFTCPPGPYSKWSNGATEQNMRLCPMAPPFYPPQCGPVYYRYPVNPHMVHPQTANSLFAPNQPMPFPQPPNVMFPNVYGPRYDAGPPQMPGYVYNHSSDFYTMYNNQIMNARFHQSQ